MRRYIVVVKHYGFGSFLFDVFMTVITGGFWLIWIFVREMRNRNI
jgi:hypothetical protein